MTGPTVALRGNPTWRTSIYSPTLISNSLFAALLCSFAHTNCFRPGYSHTALDGHTIPYVNNTDLIVWMRLAGLPNFRKLYRIINTMTLTNGQSLSVTINNTYPVSAFSGKKYVIVAGSSILGGRNIFLGWVYIAVSIVTLAVGTFFLVRYIQRPRYCTDVILLLIEIGCELVLLLM